MMPGVVGMRMVFSLPMDMRANWIFRVTPIPAGPGCMIARRRALYALSVVPVCLGMALAEVCLHGMQKLPFTFSYLPGKPNFNMSFLLCSMVIFQVVVKAAQMERDSFDDSVGYAAVVGVLLALAVGARGARRGWRNLKEGHCNSKKPRSRPYSRSICIAMESRRWHRRAGRLFPWRQETRLRF
jgi:hypothetical protein